MDTGRSRNCTTKLNQLNSFTIEEQLRQNYDKISTFQSILDLELHFHF